MTVSCSMFDVESWLGDAGLSEVADVFREEAIERLDQICVLTDGDLRELGLKMGARQRLLSRIASEKKRQAGRSAPSPAVPSSTHRQNSGGSQVSTTPASEPARLASAADVSRYAEARYVDIWVSRLCCMKVCCRHMSAALVRPAGVRCRQSQCCVSLQCSILRPCTSIVGMGLRPPTESVYTSTLNTPYSPR